MEIQSYNPHQKSVVVIGAGISGLCVAYWLKSKGINVTVFEKDSTVGGTMKTLHEDGWLIERGPNSALETTPLLKQLFKELGIIDKHIYAYETASKRYIVRNGKLELLPMSFGPFISTNLWTLGGKLRLLKEPFIGRAKKEESVAEFVERRLGKEFLDYAINPFVAGVYAGSPEKLSVQSAFPKLYALEEKYGGLIKGMIGSRKERKARKEVAKDRAKLFSFVNGMETLPKAIAEKLGKTILLNSQVEHIVPMKAGKYPVYTITYYQKDIKQTIEADVVVLASPAHASAKIISNIDPDMSTVLNSIYYPPVSEIFLGYDKEQLKHPLDGFGFLVPAIERRNILGTIWSSSLFPNRALSNSIALTTFIGGSRQPELTNGSDEQIIKLVTEELQFLMQIEGKPKYTKVIRWDKAIPQYNLGYHKVVRAIERFEQNFQGTFICSNYRGGIAVGDCVMNADQTVSRIMEMIRTN